MAALFRVKSHTHGNRFGPSILLFCVGNLRLDRGGRLCRRDHFEHARSVDSARIGQKRIDGVAELMRAEGRRETPLATLSRGVCGILSGKSSATLVLNVPGSPSGAVSSLKAALPVLPHALDLLDGKTEHAGLPKARASKQQKTAKHRKG